MKNLTVISLIIVEESGKLKKVQPFTYNDAGLVATMNWSGNMQQWRHGNKEAVTWQQPSVVNNS